MDVRGERLCCSWNDSLGIAREPKEVIDHEGKAYLIPCRPCQLKGVEGLGGP
jgi:hypothetical protein